MEENELTSVRATGRSVDEAIFKGLQQMEISIDEVSIEIIQTETKGILGIGAKPAIVQLTRRPAEDFEVSDYFRKPAERDARPERREKREKREGRDRRGENRRNEAKKPDISAENERKPAPEAKPAPSIEEPDRKKERRDNRSRRPEKQERREEPAPAVEAKPVPAAEAKPAPAVEAKPAPDAEVKPAPEKKLEYTEEAAIGNPAAEFVKGLIERMGAEGRVLAAQDDDCLRLKIDSEMMGMLIGHRGETLDAMQYLTGLVVNRSRKTEGYTRVTLNTEEYREKREETLRRLARKVASQVRATGRPRVLEPMNPYERRVLHSTLQNHPDVTTHSEGEEPNRRVVVTPRRKGGRPGYQKRSGGRRRSEPRANSRPRSTYDDSGENDVISREEYMRLYEAAKAARVPSLDRRPPEAPAENNEI